MSSDLPLVEIEGIILDLCTESYLEKHSFGEKMSLEELHMQLGYRLGRRYYKKRYATLTGTSRPIRLGVFLKGHSDNFEIDPDFEYVILHRKSSKVEENTYVKKQIECDKRGNGNEPTISDKKSAPWKKLEEDKWKNVAKTAEFKREISESMINKKSSQWKEFDGEKWKNVAKTIECEKQGSSEWKDSARETKWKNVAKQTDLEKQSVKPERAETEDEIIVRAAVQSFEDCCNVPGDYVKMYDLYDCCLNVLNLTGVKYTKFCSVLGQSSRFDVQPKDMVTVMKEDKDPEPESTPNYDAEVDDSGKSSLEDVAVNADAIADAIRHCAGCFKFVDVHTIADNFDKSVDRVVSAIGEDPRFILSHSRKVALVEVENEEDYKDARRVVFLEYTLPLLEKLARDNTKAKLFDLFHEMKRDVEQSIFYDILKSALITKYSFASFLDSFRDNGVAVHSDRQFVSYVGKVRPTP